MTKVRDVRLLNTNTSIVVDNAMFAEMTSVSPFFFCCRVSQRTSLLHWRRK